MNKPVTFKEFQELYYDEVYDEVKKEVMQQVIEFANEEIKNGG